MKADQNRLYNDVLFLTEIRPYRNFENTDTLNAVANHIGEEFVKMGLACNRQTWQAFDDFYHNIIGSYNPDKEKRLIIGAHYDVCGDQPGADDNASAVAGLLETARIISRIKPDLDYGIDFIAYSLEEPPFFGSNKMGSYIHAQSVADNKENILGMICYEMIGYFSDEPGSQTYPNEYMSKNYPDTGNFIAVVGIERYKDFNNRFFDKMKKDSKIAIEIANFPDNDPSACLSDQMSYWKFDIPALMINDTAFLRNRNYHMGSDTIDTLNFEKMAEVVNSTIAAIINLNE